MRDIGKIITQLRVERGWSRYRLAVNSRVSFSYINGLEENNHSPSIEVLDKIALAFGIPLYQLIEISENLEGDSSENMNCQKEE